MSLELRDARRSLLDREWLITVYPFYLHDLSAFDNSYYTLDDRGLWSPDHLPSWLQEDTRPPADHRRGRPPGRLRARQPGPVSPPAAGDGLPDVRVLRAAHDRGHGIGRRAVFTALRPVPRQVGDLELPRNTPAISFWRGALGESGGGRHPETSDAKFARSSILPGSCSGPRVPRAPDGGKRGSTRLHPGMDVAPFGCNPHRGKELAHAATDQECPQLPDSRHRRGDRQRQRSHHRRPGNEAALPRHRHRQLAAPARRSCSRPPGSAAWPPSGRRW